ncbi:Malonyl-CoA O-methyltransferase BioC, partial [Stegodyphus mimosarum]
MLSDASLYSEHHSMQVHDTKLFLTNTVSLMDWTNQSNDVVMDIGCGPGNSCHKLLLPYFPNVKKVIAVDVLPEMIEYAQKYNCHPKIEYHVANIECKETIERWRGEISKVISIYCFNWLKDQKQAFSNIYEALKPGGEASLLFVLSTPFWDSYKDHIQNPKWNAFLKNVEQRIPNSHFQKYRAPYYEELLRTIGFDIIVCEDEQRKYAYPSDDDCRAACASRCALTSHIPLDLRKEFEEELFKGFLKYNGRNTDGSPELQYLTLSVLIRKPLAEKN